MEGGEPQTSDNTTTTTTTVDSFVNHILKGGQYVFIHSYPSYLSHSDITNALLEIDDLKLRLLEFSSSGNIAIVVKSSKDRRLLLQKGYIDVQSELNPEQKARLKLYWGGELPEPDPPLFFRDARWTLSKDGQLAQLVKMINTHNKIVVFTGEEVPNEIGIPDFRPPKDIDWEIFNEFTREKVLQIQNLEIRTNYWAYHSKLYEAFVSANPSIVHQFLRYLEEQNKLHSVINQNIDGLNERVLQRTPIINLNGSEMAPLECPTTTCPPQPRQAHHHPSSSTLSPPVCPTCSQPLKPSVLAFDEDPSAANLEASIRAIVGCDFLLVLGSSFVWSPSVQLPDLCQKYGKRLISVNPSKTVFDGVIEMSLLDQCGSVCASLLGMLQSGNLKVGTTQVRKLGTKRTGSFTIGSGSPNFSSGCSPCRERNTPTTTSTTSSTTTTPTITTTTNDDGSKT